MPINYRDWIIRDPKICKGQPVIKGTDTTLRAILDHLSLGDSLENIVKTYHGLVPEAVQAVIAFAAQSTVLDLPDIKDGSTSNIVKIDEIQKGMASP